MLLLFVLEEKITIANRAEEEEEGGNSKEQGDEQAIMYQAKANEFVFLPSIRLPPFISTLFLFFLFLLVVHQSLYTISFASIDTVSLITKLSQDFFFLNEKNSFPQFFISKVKVKGHFEKSPWPSHTSSIEHLKFLSNDLEPLFFFVFVLKEAKKLKTPNAFEYVVDGV